MKKGDINCSESWKRRKPCKQVTYSHSLSPNSKERNMSTPCRGCSFFSFRSKSEDCSVQQFLRSLTNTFYYPKSPEYSTELAGKVGWILREQWELIYQRFTWVLFWSKHKCFGLVVLRPLRDFWYSLLQVQLEAGSLWGHKINKK